MKIPILAMIVAAAPTIAHAQLFPCGIFDPDCSQQRREQEQRNQAQQARMQNLMSAWVGHSIADVVMQWGPATTAVPLDSTSGYVQWRRDGSTTGFTFCNSAGCITNPPQITTCLLTFVVVSDPPGSSNLKDLKIRSWRWSGAC